MKRRRDFLSQLGGMSAFSPLVSALISGMTYEAIAQSTGNQPKKLISCLNWGAPSRWMFDLFLNPTNSSRFQRNPGMGTHFGADGNSLPWEQININGTYVPYMWGLDVASTNGGWTPSKSLLNNMINVRGIEMPTDGHAENTARVYRPEAGGTSLNGALADKTLSPFPAIATDLTSIGYNSHSGKALTTVFNRKGKNPLISLLSPFQNSVGQSYRTKRELMNEAIQRSVAAMQSASLQQGLGVNGLAFDKSNAEKLFKRTFGNLDEVWDSLYSKYQDLFYRSVLEGGSNKTIPGLTDRPIGRPSDPQHFQIEGSLFYNTDLRTLIDDKTYWPGLIEGFAIAEFVMKEQLAGSFIFGTDYARDLNFQNSENGPFVRKHMFLDHHGTSAAASQFVNTLMYRGITACLLELINQLKINNLYNDTLVELVSEFNRSPRQNMKGSDHAFKGASLSMWSGAFDSGLKIIGNIEQSSKEPQYEGTWGNAAPTFDNGDTLKIADVVYSKAAFLGAGGHITNNGKLILGPDGKLIRNLTAEILDV